MDTPVPAMPIAVGARLPSVALKRLGPDGMETLDTAALFAAGTSVLFGVPGAFTPTCSGRHLPGFIEQAAALRARGVARIACLSVNDPFVMAAWADAQGAGAAVEMLPDGNGDFTRVLGLEKDARGAGLGLRCKRFAMIVEDGVVRHIAVDESGLDATSAEKVLAAL